ncbi:MAG: hypothetical protein R2939_14975 [Kofleriaceae bacterium]
MVETRPAWVLAALLAASGCGRGTGGTTAPAPSAVADAAPARVVDAARPDPAALDELACVASAADAAVCAARGPGFTYGPEPYIYCGGIPPQPGDRERALERSRTSPCLCNDDAALAAHREMCMRVPSAPPR